MSLPDLCLAPHEVGDLAPGESLCAPATFRVHVHDWLGGDDYLIRAVKARYHYPEWCARRERKKHAPLLWLDGASDAKCTTLAALIKTGIFQRKIYLDEQGRLASEMGRWFRELSIDPIGQSVWANRNEDTLLFRWELIDELRWPPLLRREATAYQIELDVATMLADSRSHCAFGWNWLRLDQNAKNRVIFQLRRGTYREFEALLQAVIWSDVQWVSSESEVWEWNFDLFDFNEIAAVEGISAAIHGWISAPNVNRAFSAREQRLVELLFIDFGIRFNRDMDRYFVALPSSRALDYECIVAVSPPTTHQILEAKLHLRDFLRDKVSSTELAELMSEN